MKKHFWAKTYPFVAQTQVLFANQIEINGILVFSPFHRCFKSSGISTNKRSNQNSGVLTFSGNTIKITRQVVLGVKSAQIVGNVTQPRFTFCWWITTYFLFRKFHVSIFARRIAKFDFSKIHRDSCLRSRYTKVACEFQYKQHCGMGCGVTQPRFI